MPMLQLAAVTLAAPLRQSTNSYPVAAATLSDTGSPARYRPAPHPSVLATSGVTAPPVLALTVSSEHALLTRKLASSAAAVGGMANARMALLLASAPVQLTNA